MNHAQLIRLRANQLLKKYNYLLPSSTQDSAFTEVLPLKGFELVQALADNLSIILNPVAPSHPLLQNSIANFRLIDPDFPEFGGEICYDSSLPQPDQAFAIAHEIAHYTLHKGQAVCQQRDLKVLDSESDILLGRVEEYNPRNRHEYEANLFGLELVMPHYEIRDCYLRFSQNQKPVNGILLVEKLAAHFGVNPYRILMQLSNVFLAPGLPVNTSPESESEIAVTASINLGPDQEKAAITATPALVMAGPGSGKTRTLVERVRYLLSQPEANPARLLVLTFSNKAAQELRERLAGLGDMMAEMPIGTLHSYGLDFLRRYAEYISLERDFRLLDQARAYLLMEDLLVKFPAGYYIQEDQPFQYLYSLLEDFSRAKDFLRTPQNYLAAVEAMQQAAENGEQSVFKSEDVAKAFERAEIYRIYETEKKARGQVDFSDLIMLTVQLLSTKPEVLAEERQRYDEILVDEYQDINYASGELLRWLTSPSRGGKANLWTVGDVNQSIYRFRGAYPHQASVTAFQQEYGGPKPVTGLELSNNYRSVSSIVDLANHLRGLMPEGPTRPLQSFNQEELDQINLYYNEYTDTDEEIATISASLKTHREAGHSYSDMAILCQRHEQADEITRNLTAAGVPVTRLGQFFNRPEIQQGLAALAAPSNNTGIALIRLASSKFSVLKIP